MALIALFLGILIFVVMVGLVFKIPGLGGQYIGYVYNTIGSFLSTIWDFLGKIVAPFIKEVQQAALWSVLTVGLTLPIILAVKTALAHGVKIGIREAVKNLFRISFWKDVPSVIKMGISHWWAGVKSAFSVGIRNGLKYLGKSLLTNSWKIATGFLVGVFVEVAVSFGLDYISYKLVGKGFAQAIDDWAHGVCPNCPNIGWSWGSAIQSTISGAASGAAIGFMFGGPIGAAIGAAIGAIVGFFVGGFFH